MAIMNINPLLSSTNDGVLWRADFGDGIAAIPEAGTADEMKQ